MKIIQVSCSSTHSACLTEDRRVFVWGGVRTAHNMFAKNRIKLGDFLPKEEKKLSHRLINHIVCGEENTFILSGLQEQDFIH